MVTINRWYELSSQEGVLDLLGVSGKVVDENEKRYLILGKRVGGNYKEEKRIESSNIPEIVYKDALTNQIMKLARDPNMKEIKCTFEELFNMPFEEEKNYLRRIQPEYREKIIESGIERARAFRKGHPNRPISA